MDRALFENYLLFAKMGCEKSIKYVVESEIYILEDYCTDKVKKWLKKYSRKNNSKAQYNLSCIYRLEKNTRCRLRWLERAAKLDHPKALENLGTYYIQNKPSTEKNRKIRFDFLYRSYMLDKNKYKADVLYSFHNKEFKILVEKNIIRKQDIPKIYYEDQKIESD